MSPSESDPSPRTVATRGPAETATPATTASQGTIARPLNDGRSEGPGNSERTPVAAETQMSSLHLRVLPSRAGPIGCGSPIPRCITSSLSEAERPVSSSRPNWATAWAGVRRPKSPWSNAPAPTSGSRICTKWPRAQWTSAATRSTTWRKPPTITSGTASARWSASTGGTARFTSPPALTRRAMRSRRPAPFPTTLS